MNTDTTDLARRICHAVEQRTDDCNMEMHARVLAELKAWSYETKVLNSLAGQAEQLRSGYEISQTDTADPRRFADWYALHGIPLGIGRDNARTLYDAAIGTIQSAFDASMVNGRNLAEKLLHTNEILTSDEESAIDFFTLYKSQIVKRGKEQ